MQGYVAEIEHFIKCVETDDMPKPDLHDGVRALQLVEAVEQSIRVKREVEIPV